MLLACANAGNLVLAKTVARRDEIGIRLSLGASRLRVARQLITEVLVLSLVAASVALSFATTVPSLLIRLSGNEIRNDAHLTPNLLVFLFTLLMSIVACAVASLGPVLRAMRGAANGRGGDKALAGPSSHRLRVSLLAMQIALSTVLMLGAALLTRAILACHVARPGVRRCRTSNRSRSRCSECGSRRSAQDPRDADDPGLPPLAFSSLRPITTARMEIDVRHPNQAVQKNRSLAALRPVSASYFGVLGIRFLAGRPFVDRVSGGDLVVSESAARLLWPNEDPIGKRRASPEVATSYQSPARRSSGIVVDVATTTLTKWSR